MAGAGSESVWWLMRTERWWEIVQRHEIDTWFRRCNQRPTVQSASQNKSPFKVKFTAQQPTNLSRAASDSWHTSILPNSTLVENVAQERPSKLPKALRRLKEFSKNPILHHFLIGKDHWVHLAKTAKVLSPQIWASLEQSHPICTILPSKASWGPYGPLGVNMPPCVNYDSHPFDKVNYSIPCPDTRAKRACIEEFLNSTEHGVAHTTFVLENDCPSSHWHIARLPPNFAKRCRAM